MITKHLKQKKMIDTIKFLIPVQSQIDLIKLRNKFIQFKKENLSNGSIEFEFYTSNVELGSFQRNIAIRMSDNPLGFFIEFSIPKFVKGNNVEMIHPYSLYSIIEEFYNELSFKVDYQFVHFSQWEIYKLDICYNWLFESEERAIYAMQFIQRIDYPRKQKYIYDTSVMYRGSAYTIKFYLKGPEFKKHDYKCLSYNSASQIYSYAKKILRFEVSFKRKHLIDMFGYDKLFIFHILDDEKILFFLNYYLNDKVFKYINLNSTNDLDVEQLLYSNFTKKKATMLYMFYKNYYFDTPIKFKIVSGGLGRTTIYRYKKDLKSIGIGFDIPIDSSCVNVLQELVIPSNNSKFDLNISYIDSYPQI